MSLNLLPADVLAELLYGDDRSYLILYLWKCGDRLLNAKLASGITYLSLLSSKRIIRYAIPSVIFSLRSLRYLSLCSATSLCDSPLGWSKLRSRLPQSIESFEVIAPDSPYVFLNFGPDWTSPKSECILTQYPLGESRLTDIGALLPNLQRLHLRSKRHQPPSQKLLNSMTASDLPALPSSLTSLKTETLYGEQESSPVLSLLPRSLTELDCQLSSAPQPDLEDWRNAPPDLRIAPIGGRNIYRSLEDFSWAPRTLISIHMHGLFTLAAALSLPKILQILTIGSIDTSSFASAGTNWAAELPRQLNSLTFGDLPEGSPLGKVASYLPKTLKKLNWTSYTHPWRTIVYGPDCHDDLVIPLPWPPSLDWLWLRCHMEAKDVLMLPPTITELHFRATDPADPSQVYHFPPSLTALHIDYLHLKTENYLPMSTFSSSLTTLAISQLEEGFTMKRSEIESLPSSLTHLAAGLEFGPEDLIEQSPWRLPPHLRFLSVAGCFTRWIRSFPKSITVLQLGFVRDLFESPEELFKGLPTSLTSFSLSLTGNVALEAIENGIKIPALLPAGDYFSGLPGLVSIYVTDQLQFMSSVLRTLSSERLKSLYITIPSIDDEDAPFLPQRLLSCSLGNNTPFSSALIDNWPIECLELVRQSEAKTRVTELTLRYSVLELPK